MKTIILPRPDVNVTHATERDPSAPPGSMDVVVSREGKGRSYRVVGDGTAIVKDAIEKVLSDPYSAEFLPSKSERP